MLYITNLDAPGVIRDIGETMATGGINIAKMHLGRDSSGGNAIALVEIDGRPGDQPLKKLRALPNINDVRYLEFPPL